MNKTFNFFKYKRAYSESSVFIGQTVKSVVTGLLIPHKTHFKNNINMKISEIQLHGLS